MMEKSKRKPRHVAAFLLTLLNCLNFATRVLTGDKTLLRSKEEFDLAKAKATFWVTCSFREWQVAMSMKDIALLIQASTGIYLLGRFVEARSGVKRFLAIYFTSAILRSLVIVCLDHSRGTAGISAMCGLAGATCVIVRRSRETFPYKKKSIALLVVPLMVCEILAHPTAMSGYIGSFLGGAAASWFFGPHYVGEGELGVVDKAPMRNMMRELKASSREGMNLSSENGSASEVLSILIYLIYAVQLIYCTGSNLLDVPWKMDIATKGKLISWGAKVNSRINEGEIWRLATYSFFHLNIMHLAMVLSAMNSSGHFVEKWSGARRFLSIFFTSALSCSIISYCVDPSDYVGGVGVICGIAGATCVIAWRYRKLFPSALGRTRMLLTLLYIAPPMVFENIDNPTAIFGHIGGFLGGAAASWFLGPDYLMISPKDAEDVTKLVDKAPVQHLMQEVRAYREN